MLVVDTGATDAVHPVSRACLVMEPSMPWVAAPDAKDSPPSCVPLDPSVAAFFEASAPTSLGAPLEVSAEAAIDTSPVDPSWTKPAKIMKKEKLRQRRLDTRPASGARGGDVTPSSTRATKSARTVLRSGKTLATAPALDG
jgi:hypothetical protein